MPRLGTVAPVASHDNARRVLVTWAAGPRTGKAEEVDLTPVVFTYLLYKPLRLDCDLFRTVHLIDGGAAVAWGPDDAIDMPATLIERLAEEQQRRT
jgi:hypothetical protein